MVLKIYPTLVALSFGIRKTQFPFVPMPMISKHRSFPAGATFSSITPEVTVTLKEALYTVWPSKSETVMVLFAATMIFLLNSRPAMSIKLIKKYTGVVVFVKLANV